MCLGDLGQTHADALRLCRVERLKNSAQMLGVHAHTGIRKGMTILPECCCSVRIRKIRARVPASRMASIGVHDEIQYHLLQQDPINNYRNRHNAARHHDQDRY